MVAISLVRAHTPSVCRLASHGVAADVDETQHWVQCEAAEITDNTEQELEEQVEQMVSVAGQWRLCLKMIGLLSFT